jgi:hypothetical protein
MLFSIRIPSFLGWAADTALYGIIVAEDGEGCFKLLLRFFDDFFQMDGSVPYEKTGALQ